MTHQFENDELKLICDDGEVPDDVLCMDAAKIWAEIGYGTPRAGPSKPRVDTGVPRRGLKRTGEQAWISERRRQMRECMATGMAQGHLTVGSSSASSAGYKFAKCNFKEMLGGGIHLECGNSTFNQIVGWEIEFVLGVVVVGFRAYPGGKVSEGKEAEAQVPIHPQWHH